MPYKRTVAYLYAALILKATSGIYKNVFAYPDILTAICVERRKNRESIVDLACRKRRKQLPQFLLSTVSAVYFSGNPARFLRVSVENSCTSEFPSIYWREAINSLNSLSSIPLPHILYPQNATGLRSFHLPKVKSGNSTRAPPFSIDSALSAVIAIHVAAS